MLSPDGTNADREVSLIRYGIGRAHGWIAWGFVASIVIQVFLVGLALFDEGFGFGLHMEFGFSVIGLVALAVLLSAVGGGLPRRIVGLSLLLLVLYIVQTMLPGARATYPLVAALHPVNALLLLALGVYLARGAGRARAS